MNASHALVAAKLISKEKIATVGNYDIIETRVRIERLPVDTASLLLPSLKSHFLLQTTIPHSITVREAAEQTGLPSWKLRRLCNESAVEAEKSHKKGVWLIAVASLSKYLSENNRQPEPPLELGR